MTKTRTIFFQEDGQWIPQEVTIVANSTYNCSDVDKACPYEDSVRFKCKLYNVPIKYRAIGTDIFGTRCKQCRIDFREQT